jgi:cell division transport system ATP-binding protein
LIELQHVYKRYDKKKNDVLRNVGFALEKGSMTFLTGASGAGKSTLLKLIAGLERPSKGELIVGGLSVGQLKNYELPYYRRQIGVVFQDHQLIEAFNVGENVALPLRVSGYRESDIERRVAAALSSVGLADKLQCQPSELSGGEQQRVGIARAVVARPKVLIADEPTGNLDPELSAEIMDLLYRFSQVGVTVLIATHDIGLINQMGHPILHLNSGMVS